MIPQESPQWVPARIGKLTASRMGEAIARTKDKSALCVIEDGQVLEVLGNGKTAEKKAEKLRAAGKVVELTTYERGQYSASRVSLLHELLAERLIVAKMDHYVTSAMEHGIEQEPFAAEAYEAATGEILLPSGFIDHPTIENFGATPDRFLGSNCSVQIKCPTSKTFIAWVLAGVVPEEHKPQMLAELACSRKEYALFIAFDPRMPPGKRLFVRDYRPDPAEVAYIEAEARTFLDELDTMFERFNPEAA